MAAALARLARRSAPTMMRQAAGWTAARALSSAGESHFILTATGPDRVGIVMDIAKVVLDKGGDISESRMVRMGGDFTVMMRVSASRPEADTIMSQLKGVKGMHIYTHPVSPAKFQVSPKPVFRAAFELEGINHPGLVYKVTEMFFQRGLRIEFMHTDTKLAPFGGTVLFVMDGLAVSEKPINVEELAEATEDLSTELNIDLEVTPVNEDGTPIKA